MKGNAARSLSRPSWSKVLFAVGVFFAVVAAAAAQDPTPTSRGRPQGTDGRTDGGGRANATDDDPGDERPGERRKPARLSLENGTADGRYVDFLYDAETCTVTDYRVYNTSFFESIHLDGAPCDTGPPGAERGAFEFASSVARLRIHDAPNGLLRFEAGPNSSIRFVFDPNADANATDGGIAIDAGNLSARLFLTEEDPGALIEPSGGNANATGVEGNFLVHPASGTSAERRAVLAAIEGGKVGAEIDVLLEEGAARPESLVFDDVGVKVRQKAKETFEFEVAANLTEGRAFVTNLDPALVDSGRIRIDYFDVDVSGRTRSVLIREADSLEDALDATPAEGPEHWAFADADGLHAVVAVPAFSVHMFAVVGLPLQVVPLILYGIVLAGLFFAAGGVGVYLERRAGRAK
ncbi:MAG: hypothetical protein HYT80_06425 [Euryarchaeota archaeon]|nr:hypothetical protein [Euryarchaeota archaeon]